MIWQHIKAIAWLRWRLSVNQWNRGGSLNAIFGAVLLALFVVASLFSFFVALLIGIFVLPDITPDQLLIMWDVIVIVFLFLWVMGLVTELQKSEALSLEKLLHLPLSLTGTYLLNYVSSWLSLSLVLFLPTAAGLSLALVIVKGPAMLVLFPLLLSFVIMVTALSHQFRGWLQLLMVNKRRRRTIIALVTGGFILLVQVPNLINVAVQRSDSSQGPSAFEETIDRWETQLAEGAISGEEFQMQLAELSKQRDEERAEKREQMVQRVVETATVVNVILPVGWLPLGAQAAAAGSLWSGALGTLGALLIGGASLWRSYHTTLQFYTGGFGTGGIGKGRKKQVQAPRPTDAAPNFLEKQIAWAPDQAAAVMLAGFRSMLRGPEGKMLLLTPVILFAFFGVTLFWRRGSSMPEQLLPFVGVGAVSMTMLCFVQVLCNQFGVDRAGFRALVLSPCPRRYILLGKNLAVAPLAIGIGSVVLAAIQCFLTLKFSHILASIIQLLAAYVLFCLLGNTVSVIAPSAVASGTLKPAKSKVVTILIHIVAAFLSPIVVVPAGVFLGVELLVHGMGWITGVPIYLLASLLELGIALWLYRRLLPLQAQLLQQREQIVLDAVTARAD